MDGIDGFWIQMTKTSLVYRRPQMINKKILNPDRVRKIDGGFAFIPHCFLTGFLSALSRDEILLYLFLIVAADRIGLSFYSYDAICTYMHLTMDQYVEARNGLRIGYGTNGTYCGIKL